MPYFKTEMSYFCLFSKWPLNDYRPDAISIDSGSDGSRIKRQPSHTGKYSHLAPATLSRFAATMMTGRPDSPRRYCQLVKILRVDASGRSDAKSPDPAASRWCSALSSCSALQSSWPWGLRGILHGGSGHLPGAVLVLSLGLSHPEYSPRLGLELSSSRIWALPRWASPCDLTWKGMVTPPAGKRQGPSSDNPPCWWRLGLEFQGLMRRPTCRCIKKAPKPVKRTKLTTSTDQLQVSRGSVFIRPRWLIQQLDSDTQCKHERQEPKTDRELKLG